MFSFRWRYKKNMQYLPDCQVFAEYYKDFERSLFILEWFSFQADYKLNDITGQDVSNRYFRYSIEIECNRS